MSEFGRRMEALLVALGVTADDLQRLIDTAEKNGIVPKEIRIPQWHFNGLPLVMADIANIVVHGSYPMRPSYPGETTRNDYRPPVTAEAMRQAGYNPPTVADLVTAGDTTQDDNSKGDKND